MLMPLQPKIYHIVHVKRLESIIADNYLWCEAEVIKRQLSGPEIGMKEIEQRIYRSGNNGIGWRRASFATLWRRVSSSPMFPMRRPSTGNTYRFGLLQNS